MPGSLEGRSVVVTGGGTGIGAACARTLAREGAAVTVCGRTAESLDRVAASIRETGGVVSAVVADVTEEADVERVVATAVDFGGGLHGFVANAGGGGGLAPIHLQDRQDFMRVLELNVVGTMLCIKYAVGPMAASGGGSFVGMSLIAGHVTHPYFGAYPAGKAGIESLVRNSADEYGHLNVRFNAVQPGFIRTEVMEAIQEGTPIWNSYVDQTPMRGVGEPDDVANLVRFLVSPEARWINGVSIAVDGGNFLRRGPDWSPMVVPRFGAQMDPRPSPGRA